MIRWLVKPDGTRVLQVKASVRLDGSVVSWGDVPEHREPEQFIATGEFVKSVPIEELPRASGRFLAGGGPEPKKPREWWVMVGELDDLTSGKYATCTQGKMIKVREILE